MTTTIVSSKTTLGGEGKSKTLYTAEGSHASKYNNIAQAGQGIFSGMVSRKSCCDPSTGIWIRPEITVN